MTGFDNSGIEKTKAQKNLVKKPSSLSEFQEINNKIEQKKKFLANFHTSALQAIELFASANHKNKIQEASEHIFSLYETLELASSNTEVSIHAVDAVESVKLIYHHHEYESNPDQNLEYKTKFQKDFAESVLVPFYLVYAINAMTLEESYSSYVKTMKEYISSSYAGFYSLFAILDTPEIKKKNHSDSFKAGKEIEEIYTILRKSSIANVNLKFGITEERDDSNIKKMREIDTFTSQNSTRYFQSWLASYNQILLILPLFAKDLKRQSVFYTTKTILNEYHFDHSDQEFYDYVKIFLNNCYENISPCFPDDDGQQANWKGGNLTANLKKLYITEILKVKLDLWQDEFSLDFDNIIVNYTQSELSESLQEIKVGLAIKPWRNFVSQKLGLNPQDIPSDLVYDKDNDHTMSQFIIDELTSKLQSLKDQQINQESYQISTQISKVETLNKLITTLKSYIFAGNLKYTTLQNTLLQLENLDVGSIPHQDCLDLLNRVSSEIDQKSFTDQDLKIKPTYEIIKPVLISILHKLTREQQLLELKNINISSEKLPLSLAEMVDQEFAILSPERYDFRISCSLDNILEPSTLNQWKNCLSCLVNYLNIVNGMKDLSIFNAEPHEYGDFKSLKFKSLHSKDSISKYSIRLKPNTLRDRAYFEAYTDSNSKKCVIKLTHIGVHLSNDEV
jgi:hypothetical protein